MNSYLLITFYIIYFFTYLQPQKWLNRVTTTMLVCLPEVRQSTILKIGNNRIIYYFECGIVIFHLREKINSLGRGFAEYYLKTFYLKKNTLKSMHSEWSTSVPWSLHFIIRIYKNMNMCVPNQSLFKKIIFVFMFSFTDKPTKKGRKSTAKKGDTPKKAKNQGNKGTCG